MRGGPSRIIGELSGSSAALWKRGSVFARGMTAATMTVIPRRHLPLRGLLVGRQCHPGILSVQRFELLTPAVVSEDRRGKQSRKYGKRNDDCAKVRLHHLRPRQLSDLKRLKTLSVPSSSGRRARQSDGALTQKRNH